MSRKKRNKHKRNKHKNTNTYVLPAKTQPQRKPRKISRHQELQQALQLLSITMDTISDIDSISIEKISESIEYFELCWTVLAQHVTHEVVDCIV